MQDVHEDIFGADAIRDQGKRERDLVSQYHDQSAEWNRLFWLKVGEKIQGGVQRAEARDMAEADMLTENEQFYRELQNTRKELSECRTILTYATAAQAIESGVGFSLPATGGEGSALS